MKEFNGNNGARVVINPAPFKTVKKLRQQIAKELLNHKIDVGNPKSFNDLRKQIGDNMSDYLNLIKDILLGLEVSEDFTNVIESCMRECTYNNAVINMQLFDDIPEAREDYDKIVMEVIKVNLAPFTKALSGLFAMPNEETTEPQA